VSAHNALQCQSSHRHIRVATDTTVSAIYSDHTRYRTASEFTDTLGKLLTQKCQQLTQTTQHTAVPINSDTLG